MMDISGTIRDLRLRKGYTQERLAELCGVTRQAAAKWENGSCLPDVEKLLDLARIFGVTADELLTGARPEAYILGEAAKMNGRGDNEKIVNQALKKALSYKDPDEEIDQFISFIGSQIGSDRVFVFEVTSDGKYRNTYEWCNRGVQPQIEFLQAVPMEDMESWVDTFSRGQHVVIEDIEEKAETDPTVYSWLKPQGIQSLLAYPLFGGRNFIGVDNPAPAFLRQTSELLEILIHFVETMLQRRDLMGELKWSEQQNDQFGRFSHSVQYRINTVTGQVQYDREQVSAAGYSFRADSRAELEALYSAHPEFRDHVLNDGIRKAYESKENAGVEFLSYRADRRIRWNRLSVSPFMDSSGNVLQLYGMLQDISGEHRFVEQYNKYISRLSGGLHICYLSDPIHLDYASDDLCAFLGYTREEFEQITDSIYTNVMVEEDQPLFFAYVQRLAAAPGIESCEYRLRRKDGTTVQVVDTMESVMDSSGVMYGYAYILDKSQMHTMLAMAEENEARQLRTISRQHDVMAALGSDYLNVYGVWLDEDKAQVIFLKGYVTEGLERDSAEYFSYYRVCRQYIQDRVYPADRQKMLDAMRPDTVRRAFADSDEYTVVYRVEEAGRIHFYQMKYIRMHSPEDAGKTNFVAGFKNIDNVIEEERAKNEQLQSRLDIINAILQPFACGYYYSCRDNTFTELHNSSENMAKLIGRGGDFCVCRERIGPAFPDPRSFEAINAFLDPATLDARLAGRKYMSTRVELSGLGWYELYILVVDYDEDGKTSHCIFAARDITAEKQKEEDYLRSLGAASCRERAAMQFAYLDTLTGVMNRNAFERDFCALGGDMNVGIVFCDVNRLKETNDVLGHAEGDRLLKRFSDLFREYFSHDCIYRTGGDEFVCLIGNIARDRFEERVTTFTEAVRAAGRIAAVGAACGEAEQKDELVRQAEVRMYEMKNRDRAADPQQ